MRSLKGRKKTRCGWFSANLHQPSLIAASTRGCAAETLSNALLLVAAARRPADLLAHLDDALRAALASWHENPIEMLGDEVFRKQGSICLTNMEQRGMHDITPVCVPRDRRVECLIFDDDQGFAFTQCIYTRREKVA